jgi:hypothetical protein
MLVPTLGASAVPAVLVKLRVDATFYGLLVTR